MKNVKIHPSALVESDSIGENTSIWAFTHVLQGAIIGRNCNICDHSYIENGVVIGDNVTVKCGNIIYEGVHIKDDAFIGPMVKFTNDMFPRSSRGRHPIQRHQDKSWLEKTYVEKGASIGAGAIILPGVTIGEYAMIAAGALVTKDVDSFALVLGSPARFKAWVCKCGLPLSFENDKAQCQSCNTAFKKINDSQIIEIDGE